MDIDNKHCVLITQEIFIDMTPDELRKIADKIDKANKTQHRAGDNRTVESIIIQKDNY